MLIVDDLEMDALMVRAYLAKSTSTVFLSEWAGSYQDALSRMISQPYDVCLIDVHLDEHDGVVLMQTAIERGCKASMIMLTGDNDEAAESAAMKSGAADYLIKGKYDADMLHRVIRHTLYRSRIENELRIARDDLEKRVETRTSELGAAVSALQQEIEQRKQIEDKLRAAVIRLEHHNSAKTEFVANVSHELKTPLTSMMYGVRNLLKGIAGPLPDHAVRYLKLFDAECQRLVNTINDILDIGKLDNQTLALAPIITPFKHLVTRCIETLRPQADAAGITMTASLDPAVPFVHCDPNMVQRVLHNILGNSVKFTPRGGAIHLITCLIKPDDKRVRITISDSGTGIPAEALTRVTERYFRANNRTSGSGLGLAISKSIVQLHGGELSISSPVPGQELGTEVSLTLPLAESPPTVLVGDDDPMIQEVMKDCLESQGYRVITANSGQEIILMAEANKPDLILLDLIMEDIHGTTVILSLRGSPKIRYIPIIVITGATLDEASSNILNRFSIPTLSKPCRVTDLMETIETALLSMTAFHASSSMEITHELSQNPAS